MPLCYTTKAAVDLLGDEGRSNGGPDLFVMENESKSIELEVTTDEIEKFQLEQGVEIDSDTVSDDLMATIIEFLNAQQPFDDTPRSEPRLRVRKGRKWRVRGQE